MCPAARAVNLRDVAATSACVAEHSEVLCGVVPVAHEGVVNKIESRVCLGAPSLCGDTELVGACR